MSELWFYGQQGTQRGPVEIETLRAMAASGELQPTDLVWREGMPDWVPASSVGIFAATAHASPASPPSPPPPPPPPPHVSHQPQPLGYAVPDQRGRAITSLVLGILSIPSCLCPFGGIIVGVAAIALGSGVHPGPNRPLAIAGIVCGSIGALLGVGRMGVIIF